MIATFKRGTSFIMMIFIKSVQKSLILVILISMVFSLQIMKLKLPILQRWGVEASKALIREAVWEKLDINFSNLFNIADLGCSVGPNTFIAVENIIESVKLKYPSSPDPSSGSTEFQVFFNDLPSNDFNTLLQGLPRDREYAASIVPGSFLGRLFPQSSLHFIHSSYTLHWLSKVPKELLDKNSPAWNKGRIFYASAPNEVVQAYSAQFAEDMVSFLNARAQELVHGGLMVLIIPSLPADTSPSECPLIAVMDLLGDSLIGMARMVWCLKLKLSSMKFGIYFGIRRACLFTIFLNCFCSRKYEEQGKHV